MYVSLDCQPIHLTDAILLNRISISFKFTISSIQHQTATTCEY